jgi:putative transposase
MPYNPSIHHRRSIRLPGYDYAQEGAYFVTIVTAQRECLFGEVVEAAVRLSPLGMVAAACWQAIPQHFPGVEIDAWVIMPNHVHGIIVLPGPAAVGGASGADAAASASVGAQHAAPLPIAPLPDVTAPPPAPVGAQHAAPLPIAPPPVVPAPLPDVPAPDVPRITPGSLGAIVRSFKSAVTKQAREVAWMPGVPFWQRNYYEHIVRNERQLERLRRYIDENPERWELDCENPARTRAKAKR